jgi:DNA-binding winged helix-turn-helix (wHTH) protein/tetratricopeptide (TPR) repeat protein
VAQKNSNENQITDNAGYRFKDFELRPKQRLLKKAGVPLALPPKSFDALLYLVSKSERLVPKKELIDTLWPSTFVGDANLTNIIVNLRKVVGRDAIQTVSKYGYRLTLPVEGEPGATGPVYEKFARAKDLTAQRSLDSMEQARGLLWVCIAEDPSFAPAWAWLGRCCWLLVKFRGPTQIDNDLAAVAFQRAFALDADLAVLHQFYTPFELDTGRARDAMTRLRQRLARHPSEPETLTSLVQVLRFCGLLDESLQASRRASELDPTTVTSVPHTHFFRCDYRATLETYGGRACYYLDAAAWAALGEVKRALTLLSERLKRMPMSGFIGMLMGSLHATLEGRYAEAVSLMGAVTPVHEPEGLILLARHYSQMGMADYAIRMIEQAAAQGFVSSEEMLTHDPTLVAVRKHQRYATLLKAVRVRTREARAEWKSHSVFGP